MLKSFMFKQFVFKCCKIVATAMLAISSAIILTAMYVVYFICNGTFASLPLPSEYLFAVGLTFYFSLSLFLIIDRVEIYENDMAIADLAEVHLESIRNLSSRVEANAVDAAANVAYDNLLTHGRIRMRANVLIQRYQSRIAAIRPKKL